MDNNFLGLIDVANSILAELELLTSSVKATALVRFQQEFLLTDLQRKIYNAIDGEKDSQEIAETTGASLRAVQLLIKELTEKDLIDISKRGRSNIPKRSVVKIATYFARQDIAEAGGTKDER